MRFSSKILSIVFLLAFGAGCLPYQKKSALKFVDLSQVPVVRGVEDLKVRADFESLRKNLFEKSCLKCHHGRQENIVQFETAEDLEENADDIVFYIQSGCDIGSCMPPLRQDGTPKAPIPTDEVVQAFKTWIDNGFSP